MNMFQFNQHLIQGLLKKDSTTFLKSSIIFHYDSSIIFNSQLDLCEFVIQYIHSFCTHMMV